MWISEKMALQKEGSATETFARVENNLDGNLTLSADKEYRNVKKLQPFGVFGVPPKGSKALLTTVDNMAVCAGVVDQKKPFGIMLEPGELLLYSQGGAYIILKNDGKVLINGKEFI